MRVSEGAVNSEVVVQLAGGTEVFSIVTREAVDELGLKPGVSATVVIKAEHIILGVSN
ncbi:Molybdenum-pterin-binding protein MopA [compost metagenome]